MPCFREHKGSPHPTHNQRRKKKMFRIFFFYGLTLFIKILPTLNPAFVLSKKETEISCKQEKVHAKQIRQLLHQRSPTLLSMQQNHYLNDGEMSKTSLYEGINKAFHKHTHTNAHFFF